MPGRLEGKSVIVTGGGSGQGRVAAQLFAREGGHVVVADADAEGIEETVAGLGQADGELTPLHVDLMDEDANRRMVQLAVESEGRLDAIYTPAGRARFGTAAEMTLDDWVFAMGQELTITFLACKHALRAMVDGGGGSIINVSSTSGMHGVPRHASHAATKQGIVGLTRQIAVEYGPKGVRCNAIAPGFVAYEPGERREPVGSGPSFSPESIPLGRFTRPQDTASAALFLASDDSSFITGQVIVVDGGASVR